jgi:hypothetical protein
MTEPSPPVVGNGQVAWAREARRTPHEVTAVVTAMGGVLCWIVFGWDVAAPLGMFLLAAVGVPAGVLLGTQRKEFFG